MGISGDESPIRYDYAGNGLASQSGDRPASFPVFPRMASKLTVTLR